LSTQDEILGVYGVVVFAVVVFAVELSVLSWSYTFWLSMVEMSISFLTSSMVRDVISSSWSTDSTKVER